LPGTRGHCPQEIWSESQEISSPFHAKWSKYLKGQLKKIVYIINFPKKFENHVKGTWFPAKNLKFGVSNLPAITTISQEILNQPYRVPRKWGGKKHPEERDPPMDSRLELDNLNIMLQNHSFDPSNNNFSSHQIPDPHDLSKTYYSLPDYLSIYVLTLLAKMNDHKPPDSLARTLAPFFLLWHNNWSICCSF
jgi:hypothetical protein